LDPWRRIIVDRSTPLIEITHDLVKQSRALLLEARRRIDRGVMRKAKRSTPNIDRPNDQ